MSSKSNLKKFGTKGQTSSTTSLHHQQATNISAKRGSFKNNRLGRATMSDLPSQTVNKLATKAKNSNNQLSPIPPKPHIPHGTGVSGGV